MSLNFCMTRQVLGCLHSKWSPQIPWVSATLCEQKLCGCGWIRLAVNRIGPVRRRRQTMAFLRRWIVIHQCVLCMLSHSFHSISSNGVRAQLPLISSMQHSYTVPVLGACRANFHRVSNLGIGMLLLCIEAVGRDIFCTKIFCSCILESGPCAPGKTTLSLWCNLLLPVNLLLILFSFPRNKHLRLVFSQI